MTIMRCGAKIEPMTRDFLIKVAEAMPGGPSRNLTSYCSKLAKRGRFAAVTENEIDVFDILFDTATALNEVK